ncbi:TPA: hypothetical protein N0F65_006093 [Lagenidium giganteum]|uniref:Uncharacterized protein n=1 Tax=Lagenidium giganteum TaxID=4803 RepID=A0AAV2Z1P7_9STRA|nr:TPA: hypothetical protein N0F65_006093 [Lagenidium giganteum]
MPSWPLATAPISRSRTRGARSGARTASSACSALVTTRLAASSTRTPSSRC